MMGSLEQSVTHTHARWHSYLDNLALKFIKASVSKGQIGWGLPQDMSLSRLMTAFVGVELGGRWSLKSGGC